MALVKWISLAAMILVLAAPSALAGPNAGGVLVMHATTMTYTTDFSSYAGRSEVACGQDGPFLPAVQVCPPYDPIRGAIPCVPTAANPTSSMAEGVKHIWYVMAAFPDDSCPRLKGLAFRIRYDENKIKIGEHGISDSNPLNFPQQIASDEDGRDFPANRSGMAVAFDSTRTSRLQEVWWFAGYTYPDAGEATFALEVKEGQDGESFVDDSFPAESDLIAGFGVLGLGGAIGFNPPPGASPTGSCCATDGTCTVTVATACADPSIWTLSGTCDPNICPAPPANGACCTLEGLCTLTLQAACAQPGVWHVDWIVCDPNPCPAQTGACCAEDESCTVTTEPGCAAPSTWIPNGNCQPNPCVTPTERTSWGRVKATYRTN